MPIRIANAPVSWGITESVDFPPEYPPGRVLDEIAEAGYSGTELGPHGFLPTDPAALRGALALRNLALSSAFVAFPLGSPGTRPGGLAHVDRTASLISSAGCRLLILSDEVCPERSAVAGRPEESNRRSWSEAEWKQAAESVREVVEHSQRFGLSVAFHHHVGTHVETREEIHRLFSLLPSEALGLCLDTGHCVYGGGDPLEMANQYGDRLLCVHLKDVDTDRLKEARRLQRDFYAAVRHGVFARLGDGGVDLGGMLNHLRARAFDGWVVVEQDVLAGGKGAAAPLANAVAGREALRRLGY